MLTETCFRDGEMSTAEHDASDFVGAIDHRLAIEPWSHNAPFQASTSVKHILRVPRLSDSPIKRRRLPPPIRPTDTGQMRPPSTALSGGHPVKSSSSSIRYWTCNVFLRDGVRCRYPAESAGDRCPLGRDCTSLWRRGRCHRRRVLGHVCFFNRCRHAWLLTSAA